MENTSKLLTVEEIQGYIISGVKPLPFLYEQFLQHLYNLQEHHRASMMPIAIFELYHLKLQRKLVQRICIYKQQMEERKTRKKFA